MTSKHRIVQVSIIITSKNLKFNKVNMHLLNILDKPYLITATPLYKNFQKDEWKKFLNNNMYLHIHYSARAQ